MTPAYLFFKFFWHAGKTARLTYEKYKHRQAVSVPRNLPTSESLSFIVQNHREILAGAGLVEADPQAGANQRALAQGAALYGKRRLIQAAGAAAVAADALSSTKKIPELLQVLPIDAYRSELVFQMLPGQTSELWAEKHLELASGFRVPRVSVSQDLEMRGLGLVQVSVFHQDALESSSSLDTTGWFDE
ncbi:hypothetical protein ACTQ49_10145 [Luteococcus sp. Sow4_B9]|uniref:hypothetical protein n=1 Tax=Luteococcus sp. Sow4_B9 TaxID=3438792 RepID=UPI003F96BBB4